MLVEENSGDLQGKIRTHAVLEIEMDWHVSPFLKLASQKNTQYIDASLHRHTLDLFRCFEHAEMSIK